MSGGSYSYIYCKDAGELFDYSSINTLDIIISRLIELGYKDVAKDLYRMKNAIEQSVVRVEVMKESLEKVMKAVEWYDSADIGEDSLLKVIEQYRLNNAKENM